MKSFVVLSALVAVTLAAPQFQQQYNPQQYEVIPIVKQEQEINPDGSYRYSYETANGIGANEQGYLKNPGTDAEALNVQGNFGYTSPEGIPISLAYIADENGFRAEGAHLPVPPPTPDYILRALDYIASQPQKPQYQQPQYQQPQYQKPQYQKPQQQFQQPFRG